MFLVCRTTQAGRNAGFDSTEIKRFENVVEGARLQGLLSNFASGTRVLSIQQYVVSLAARWAGTDLFAGTVKIGVALAMCAAFVVAGTWLTINRLRSFSIAGETS